MPKEKLELANCKTALGKKHEYDVMLLTKNGNLLTSVTVYKENGMTEAQKKSICNKLKLALDDLVESGI